MKIINYKDISAYALGSVIQTPSGVCFVVIEQQKVLTKVQRIDTKEILYTQKVMCKLR